MGFIALSLIGYTLSHSPGTLASAFGLSDTILGVTLLSLATTLLEIFVAFMSGCRGQSGILVANTLGSNIFPLTLCVRTMLVAVGGKQGDRLVKITWTWASSQVVGAMLLLGSRRWMGVVRLLAYVALLVMNFSLFRT